MAISLGLESCRGCKRAMNTDFNCRCPYCDYDYYEEINNHKRTPEGMSLNVCLNLEKLFGKKIEEI